jgi:hypothetical protein
MQSVQSPVVHWTANAMPQAQVVAKRTLNFPRGAIEDIDGIYMSWRVSGNGNLVGKKEHENTCGKQ